MDSEIDQTSEMTFSDRKDFLINRMRMSHSSMIKIRWDITSL